MLGGYPAAVGIFDGDSLGDAEKRIVGLEHPTVGKKRLVGGDQRQVMAIGQIEKGERKVDSLELIKLSSFFSIPLEDLLKPEMKSVTDHSERVQISSFGRGRGRGSRGEGRKQGWARSFAIRGPFV